MKYSSLSIKELIKMQKDYRRGIIKEKDLPKDELKDLKLLYRIQINFLINQIYKYNNGL